MTGEELITFCTGLNGEHSIDKNLLFHFANLGCALLEGERPWIFLRKTNVSITVPAMSNGWDTPISIIAITDINRFFGNTPVKLYSGSTVTEERWQVPIENRLEYKDDSSTFCYDESAGAIYFNGQCSGGTLSLSYIKNSPTFNKNSTNIWPGIDSRKQDILGFYAIGVYKGAVDWDSVVQNQLPENREVLKTIKNSLILWDAEKQCSMAQPDYTNRGNNRAGSSSININ